MDEPILCPRCQGTLYVSIDNLIANGLYTKCIRCGGRGRISFDTRTRNPHIVHGEALRMRVARTAAGVSRADMAKRLERSYEYVVDVENEVVAPPHETERAYECLRIGIAAEKRDIASRSGEDGADADVLGSKWKTIATESTPGSPVYPEKLSLNVEPTNPEESSESWASRWAKTYSQPRKVGVSQDHQSWAALAAQRFIAYSITSETAVVLASVFLRLIEALEEEPDEAIGDIFLCQCERFAMPFECQCGKRAELIEEFINMVRGH